MKDTIDTIKNIGYGAIGILTLMVLYFCTQLFNVNTAGYMIVKQAAFTGSMDVITAPGVYGRMFGQVHEYRISDVYEFARENDVISVRFNDAATAKVSGQIKYRLPMNKDRMLQIQQDFRSDDAVRADMIRPIVAAALKQTATLFGAEEVYSTRRAEFINLVNEQIKNGLYDTVYQEVMRKDDDGSEFRKHLISVKLDAKGNPIITEPSTFARYDVELIQLLINDIHFDDKTNELIAKRKEADQEKVVARARAERAKQDAITAEMQGKADIATAEAKALVEKKTAVVNAQRDKEVAEQNALKAEAEKKATVAKGQAEAEAATLKVKAGLTPLDKANIDKETAIGVAHELSQVRLPELMVIGGDGKGGQVNPFDAVGLQSLINISKSMSGEGTHVGQANH